MEPVGSTQPTTEQEAAMADERACSERIGYWLKKYGCIMVPIMELRPGQVAGRIDIIKIPPEVLRQMKKAEKSGQYPVQPPAASA